MSPEFPLVSVCIPSYNAEKYIGITINSLLQQTYTNIEIIVVDDGSTDNTKSILENFKDKRFKYFTGPNKGASAARNKAFLLSSGAFIKFMDADDLVNQQCIETQLMKLKERPDCIASAKWGRFFAADISDFKLSPEKIWKDMPGIDWLVNSLIDTGTNMMQPGIFLIPRSIMERAGPWNEALSLIDDFEFMVRVITNSTTVLFCDEAVLRYRNGVANSLSGRQSEKHMKSAFTSLKLGTERILKLKNNPQSRLACANTFQTWAYQFYPDFPEYCAKTEQIVKELGGSTIHIGGGKFYQLLARIIGWKNAKKMKLILTGNTV